MTEISSNYQVVEGTPRFTAKELYAARMATVKAGDPNLTKEHIRQYFHKTQDIYENVFRTLSSDEAFYIQPIHKLRHPLIFYFGHTATFFINKLALAGLTTRINQKFEEMFAVGVDEMSWDDLNDAHYNWPKVSEVAAYRQLVRQRIDSLLTSGKYQLKLPLNFHNSTDNDDNTFWWAMLMGIEHERIHLETASVHVRELPLRLVRKVGDFWSPCTITGEAPDSNPLVEFQGGNVRVGRDPEHDQYGWCVDYAVAGNSIQVAPFKASKYLVSNRAFLDFMKDGGYAQQKYWDEEGWKWVSWRKPEHPWFWVKGESEGTYRLRVQVEEIPLPWDWPVEVNNLEAKAYCNWMAEKTGKNIRLPTEAEWTHLFDVCVGKDVTEWGDTPPGNLGLEHFRSSCPVNMFQHGKIYDVVGNVWQHTETPVYPFKGFRVHPLYDDFSMPTFDGRHYSMKGGAWISTGNEASRDARFAFRRHFFQCIGIRFVEGPEVQEGKYLRNVLGMDPEVDAQADFAFGKPLDNLEPFGVRLAKLAKDTFAKHRGPQAQYHRALDLFCGAGRVSYELTSDFQEVIGSDFSARRLQIAFAVRERGSAQYSIVNENGEREARTVEAARYNWNAKRERAYFFQADPSNLHAHMHSFDLIVAWNVLENTYNPAVIPAHLISRLNPGGILLLGVHGNWNMSVVQEENMPHRAVTDLPSTTAPTLLNYIRHSVRTVATEVPLEEAHLTAVFPTSVRAGTFVDIEFVAFRKLE